MVKVVTFSALSFSLAPAIGMVWIFYQLGIKGTHIVPDNSNKLELVLAVLILGLIITALVSFVRFTIKGGQLKWPGISM